MKNIFLYNFSMLSFWINYLCLYGNYVLINVYCISLTGNLEGNPITSGFPRMSSLAEEIITLILIVQFYFIDYELYSNNKRLYTCHRI